MGITGFSGRKFLWATEHGKELKFDFIAKNLNRFKAPACEIYFSEEEAPAELRAYKLDYSKNLVIGFFLGERPSGGFTLTPSGVQLKKNGLWIAYREEKPLQVAVVQRLTYPAAFFVLDKNDLPVGQFTLYLRNEEAKEPVLVKEIFL